MTKPTKADYEASRACGATAGHIECERPHHPCLSCDIADRRIALAIATARDEERAWIIKQCREIKVAAQDFEDSAGAYVAGKIMDAIRARGGAA